MQARLLLLALPSLLTVNLAAAQTTTLQMDAGNLQNSWSLTSPEAGPDDWIGVALQPSLEHPFLVVSATMHYVDTFCCRTNSPACQASDCSATAPDWERRVITGADLNTDAAGLTPDLSNPVAQELLVNLVGPGATFTTPPWTLTADVWSMPAATVFDRPGRVFYAAKYFNGDEWMRFVTDEAPGSSPTAPPQHAVHRAIFTNDGFATRAALWGFGNVGMRVTVEPLFFVKPGVAVSSPSTVLAGQTGVPMLGIRVGAGNAATTIGSLEIDGAGSGNEATGVSAVRLVLDQDADGLADPGEPQLASGTFASDDGRVTLNPNRTLATGSAEEWLVVYDFSAGAAGGDSFSARLAGPARMSSNLGAPYVSGTTGGLGNLDGTSVMVAGTLSVAHGPAAPVARVVPAGATDLSALQVRLTAANEAFDVSGLTIAAQGSVDDLTEVTGVRLYSDLDADGVRDGGEPLLASGTFAADDGNLAFNFSPVTVPRNGAVDLLVVIDLSAAATGGDGFRAVLATADDVLASGVASGPIPSSGPRALSGAPVIGERLTVGGALVASVGVASPADGTAQPGGQDVPMLQLNLSAQAEAVRVDTLSLSASGSGDEVSDVARVRLLRDTNANGAVDAADVAVGLPQSFASDDGIVTFALSGETIPGNATRSYLVVYDLSAAPTGGETFALTVVDAAAVSATGQASAAPVTATGSFPLTGRTLTLLGGLSIDLGPQTPVAARVQPGALDVPVLQLSSAAQGETFTVAQLSLTAAGSLVDDAAVTAVRIYRDQGASGVRDTPDVLLGTATYAADDGQATFTFSPALSLSPGVTERWLVTYDLAAGAAPGQTFRTSVASAAAVVATGTLSGPAAVSGLPAQGASLSIGGGLTLTAGPANPAGGRLQLNLTRQAMLQLRASADLEPITVSAVRLTGSGSGDESQAISGVRMFVDTNADGVVDPVGDVEIAGPSVFAANDGAVTLALGAPRTLPAGASEIWLVAYDVGAAASAGQTFQLALASPTDVTAAAPSGTLPGVLGAPVTGGARTLLGELAVTAGPNAPVARTVTNNAQDVALLQARLQSTAEDFVVSALTVNAAGAMDDVADVTGLELVLDVDQSGTRSAGDAVLAGPTAFAGDDGALTFSGLNLTVPANGARDLLVTADLSGSALGGRDLRISLPSLTATGVAGRSLTPAGLPLGAGPITAGGTLEVGLGAGSPLGRVARRLDTRVPALQLRLVASTEAASLSQVILHSSGTGHEVTGLVEVELWLDSNADGAVSAGEPRLARGAFSADDGAVVLPLGLSVQVGPAVHLLATYSVSGAAIGAETFRLAHDPNVDLSFASTSGAVVVDGVPVDGGIVTIGGGFAVRAGPSNGASGLVNQALQNLAVMQLELEAINERCTVEQVTLRAAGGVDDQADIAGVRLAVDVDGDGALSAPDLVLSGPAGYANDDAELTFASVGRVLAPNVTERWLVVYDLSGQAENDETFSVRLEGADRVSVRCQVSGPVTPTGPAIDGGTFTIQEDGALVVRRGDQTPPARFVPAGTVRTPALQLRAAASVQPLTLQAVVLTASVSGPVADTVQGVDLFLDLNRDGQLDRSDQLLGSGTPDASGRVGFTGLTQALPLDEAQFLLAAVNVAAGATPGARFSIGLQADADATASSAFGAAQTTGAPFFGAALTVAGGLNVAAGRADAAQVVSNDAGGLVALDLVLSAVWEQFTVRRLTVSAQGSMHAARAVRGLSLVEDVDADGQIGAGDQVLASGLTFGEGETRASFEGLSVAVPAAGAARLLVALDLDGVARVDETLQLSLASDLDLVAQGDRRGLSSPVGAPVVGDTFTVGASFTLAQGPNPPQDDVVPADARGVPVMQLTASAANEDVTLARLQLDVSGSLDDMRGVDAFHLHRDVDGDGVVDPEDVEIGAAARPTGDDGALIFGPLTERVVKNADAHLLITVDLSGGGRAGQDVSLRLSSDASVSAFGARSGAVVARGAPIEGARLALVGAFNARLGPNAPAGKGEWPGTTFGALQVELFTRGETVTVSSLKVTLSGGTGVSAVSRVRLVHDLDGDGAAAEGEPELGFAPLEGSAVTFGGLGLSIPLDGTVRVLAEVELREDASPGETIRLAIAAPEDIGVAGSAGDIEVVGPPILGSAFTVVRRPDPGEAGTESGGCGCSAGPAHDTDAPALPLAALILGLGWRARRRR